MHTPLMLQSQVVFCSLYYFELHYKRTLLPAELTVGQWVMSQVGHQNLIGQMGHGSVGLTDWPVDIVIFTVTVM